MTEREKELAVKMAEALKDTTTVRKAFFLGVALGVGIPVELEKPSR